MRGRGTLGALLALGAVLAGAACGRPARVQGPPAAAQARRGTLLFFSDAHADLDTHPELFWGEGREPALAPAGGYARLAAAARRVRDEVGGAALLVDGGDTFQGSSAASWSRGDVVLGPQRALGVGLGVPGNWEVVYGPARLRDLAGRLNYPLIAANVVDAGTGRLLFARWLVREVGGLRVGFVGYTDPDVPRRQAPAYSAGLRYLGPESIGPAVREMRARASTPT